MKLIKTLATATALVALATVAQAQDGDPIKIGVPVGLSGANSVVAPSVVQAAELAVEEINATGASSAGRSPWKSPMTPRVPQAPRKPSTRWSTSTRST